MKSCNFLYINATIFFTIKIYHGIIPSPTKMILVIVYDNDILLITNWFGFFVFFFNAENRIKQWCSPFNTLWLINVNVYADPNQMISMYMYASEKVFLFVLNNWYHFSLILFLFNANQWSLIPRHLVALMSICGLRDERERERERESTCISFIEWRNTRTKYSNIWISCTNALYSRPLMDT